MEKIAAKLDHLVLRPDSAGINFRCPRCGNRMRNDQGMEPMCTGPHPSLDEHEPTIMVRV